MAVIRPLWLTLASRPRLVAWVAYASSLVAVLLVLQLLHNPSLWYMATWPIGFWRQFLVNLGLLGFAFLTLYAITASAFYAACGVVGPALVLGYADRVKISTLDQPILPSDFLFLHELFGLDSHYLRSVFIGGGVLLILAGFAVFTRRRVPHLRPHPLSRATILACAAGCLAWSVPHRATLVPRVSKAAGARNYFWNPIANYQYNGVLFGLLMSFDAVLIREPPGYSQAAVDKVLGRFRTEPSRADARRPNVILYMSESFWDLRNLAKLDLGMDPTPRYHALVDAGYGFQLLTPTFGGGTCDPEFELLTGLPVKYFPPGSRAFQQYIHRPVPSIARLFKQHGYYAAAVHTHLRWYWNRNHVYPLAGFDAFRGIEDIGEPDKRGIYASDHQLVQAVLEETRRTTSPYFVFAISVQNHGPYEFDRYGSYDPRLSTRGLSPAAATEARNYAQGLLDADRSLDDLVKFVDEQKDPTVLIFFGDHLPAAEALLTETGFLSLSSLTDEQDPRRRYAEAGVVHANFEIPRPRGKVLSTEFLPLYLAELADLGRPPYYGFLAELQARYPGLSRYLAVSSQGKLVAPDAAELRDIDESSWLVVYDLLFGKRYAARYFETDGPAK